MVVEGGTTKRGEGLLQLSHEEGFDLYIKVVRIEVLYTRTWRFYWPIPSNKVRFTVLNSVPNVWIVIHI